MSFDDSVQYLVSVGEHTIGEEEGGSIVGAGRVGDEEGEQGGNGVDLVPWSRGERMDTKIRILLYVIVFVHFVCLMCTCVCVCVRVCILYANIR